MDDAERRKRAHEASDLIERLLKEGKSWEVIARELHDKGLVLDLDILFDEEP